jgi:hypothetical protein
MLINSEGRGIVTASFLKKIVEIEVCKVELELSVRESIANSESDIPLREIIFCAVGKFVLFPF